MKAKKRMRWILALAVGLGLAGTARAQTTSDSLTVTITPNAYYAVDIDTGSNVTGLGMDLGSVALGVSTHTTLPASVAVKSTYAKTDLTLTGAIITASNPWSFDADTTLAENDALAAWAVFTDTSVTVAPILSAGAFSGTAAATAGSDVISSLSQDVGDGTQADRFVLGSSASGYKTMEDIPAEAADAAASHANLWLKFRLPASSTSNGQQKVTITLTAGVPN
jgi:hypothetical protein